MFGGTVWTHSGYPFILTTLSNVVNSEVLGQHCCVFVMHRLNWFCCWFSHQIVPPDQTWLVAALFKSLGFFFKNLSLLNIRVVHCRTNTTFSAAAHRRHWWCYSLAWPQTSLISEALSPASWEMWREKCAKRIRIGVSDEQSVHKACTLE